MCALPPAASANPVANPASVDFGAVSALTFHTLPIDITVDPGYFVELTSGSDVFPFSFDFGMCMPLVSGDCTVEETFLPQGIGSL